MKEVKTMNTISTAKSEHHAGSNTFLSGKTLSICLGLIVLAVVAVTIFKVSLGTLFFAGVLLLCPLLHVWMMRGEHGRTMKDGGQKH